VRRSRLVRPVPAVVYHRRHRQVHQAPRHSAAHRHHRPPVVQVVHPVAYHRQAHQVA
jgi:hypothetical protein